MAIPNPSGMFGESPMEGAEGSSDARELFETTPDNPSWSLRGNVVDEKQRGHMLRLMAIEQALAGQIEFSTLMFYSTMFTAATGGAARKEYVEAVTLGAKARMPNGGADSPMYDRYFGDQQRRIPGSA